MAYANTTPMARKGVFDRLSRMKDSILTAIRQRRIYERTVSELNNLTDRELNDLGISRFSIPELARESAYGK
ncbi:MAG: DUF1127 domain-containing protein [Tabrizicola sp.]|nr:DUF1127 domain-containing protein [Tabrizicola sp.]HMS96220.1 DUF1127 domain-containing protein [Tabrizicola sp.]